MRRVFTILFLLMAVYTCLQAQDITGVWQGHFRSGDLRQRYFADEDRYRFEVQIAQHSKLFKAVTYSYQSTVFYGKADANGTVNPKTGKVLLQELKITEMRMQGGGDACIMTCFLQYSKSGDEEFLEGSYVSMNARDSSNCGKGTVFLRRTTHSDFYKEPFLVKREKEKETEKKETAVIGNPTTVARNPSAATHKPATVLNPAPRKKSAPAATPLKPSPTHIVKPHTPESGAKNNLAKITPVPVPLHVPRSNQADTLTHNMIKARDRIAAIPLPGVLAARSNQLVQTISLSTNEVTLNIYDDGAIDNDTISVYLDKKLIISNARLSDKAIVVKLHLDDNDDYHELVMVAENEGEIPPNTSLMVVKAGDKEYEVRISSNEQKNAVVVFKYEKQ